MPPTLTVDTAGAIALQHLQIADQASVLGVTSRGVFLRLPGERVIFLSTERWRGPLTVNLAGNAAPLKSLSIGMTAEVNEAQIEFPQAGLIIQLTGVMPWTPLPPEGAPLPIESRCSHLYETSHLLLPDKLNQNSAYPSNSVASLLPALLGWDDPPQAGDSALFSRLASLQAALRSRQALVVAAALGDWLGLGIGLTPSGDDLAMGVLLALSRWGEALGAGLEAGDILTGLLPLARRKTTLLSANLLECAAQGQADERLLLALDGLVSGSPPSDACANLLAEYGHSSGADALVGISVVLCHHG